jgi:uncharacterized protein YfkK (UPF0435 family)
MSLKVSAVLGRARVRDLRALFVPHPGMHMDGVAGTPLNDFGNIVQQPLADANPVTVVAAQLQIINLRQEPLRDPGIIEDTSPVRLVSDWNSHSPFQIQSFAHELHRLRLAE